MLLSEMYWKERITNSSHNRDEFFIIAKVDDVIVGIVGAEKTRETWMLKSVYVEPRCRGQGIGHQLLEAIIWKLDNICHAHTIELKVNSLQESAINLYKKSGFTIVHTLENQESGDGNRYTKFKMYRNQCSLHR